jgi:hypothetical protein
MLPDPPRKPINATLSRTDLPVERRGDGLVPAPCAACGRDDLRVMLRTDYVVYFRLRALRGSVECRKPERAVRHVARCRATGTEEGNSGTSHVHAHDPS